MGHHSIYNADPDFGKIRPIWGPFSPAFRMWNLENMSYYLFPNFHSINDVYNKNVLSDLFDIENSQMYNEIINSMPFKEKIKHESLYFEYTEFFAVHCI